MELQLANQLQHHIADLLWATHDPEKVRQIIAVYGADAITVLNMMLAAHYDNIDAIDIAGPELERIKNL